MTDTLVERRDPYQDLRDAAARARSLLMRFAGEGNVLHQVENGDWRDALSPREARDAADLVDAMAEHVRHARAMVGLLGAESSTTVHDLTVPLADVLSTGLPLNRKERFYTGTVLPMIVASDGFAHLDRLLDLCGLPSAGFSTFNARERWHEVTFYTEYNFAESCYTPTDKARFPDPPPGADTPDLVLAGRDWLLCIEAKVFHNPKPEALNAQMAGQRLLVDYWSHTLHLDRNHVAHVLLLPSGLNTAGVTHPVVTWESLLDAYRVVGPMYWVNMLATALDRYNDLVSLPETFGQNAESHLTGLAIQAAAATGDLPFTHMGRKGGLGGALLAEDIASGRWTTQPYEVRSGALPSNPNWFEVSQFLARIEAAY